MLLFSAHTISPTFLRFLHGTLTGLEPSRCVSLEPVQVVVQGLDFPFPHVNISRKIPFRFQPSTSCSFASGGSTTKGLEPRPSHSVPHNNSSDLAAFFCCASRAAENLRPNERASPVGELIGRLRKVRKKRAVKSPTCWPRVTERPLRKTVMLLAPSPCAAEKELIEKGEI